MGQSLKLSSVIDSLYRVKWGGPADTTALSALGGAMLLSTPYLASSAPMLATMGLSAAGASWIAWRLLGAIHAENVLPASLNLKSSVPPYDPVTGFSPVHDRNLGKNAGLLFGYITDTGEPVYLPDEYLTRHLFLAGMTGVGKTVGGSLYLFQQIQRGGGLLFVDGKLDSETQTQIYHFCKWCGREADFLMINPGNPEKSNTYNPILYGDPDEVADRCIALIPSTASNAGADYYKQEAKRALTIIFAAFKKLKKAYNFMDVSILLNSPKAVAELLTQLRRVAPGSEEEKQFALFVDAFYKPDFKTGIPMFDVKEFKAMLGGIGSRMFQFGSGQFGKILNSYDPEVKLYDAIVERKVVFIALPTMGKSLTASNFAKMFLADLMTATSWIQALPKDERPNPPCFAFLDEFGSYVIEQIARLFEQARSARIILMPAMQTFANLKAISEELSEMVTGNTATKIFYRLGTTETATTASAIIGKKAGVAKSLSTNQSKSRSQSFLAVTPESGVGDGGSRGDGEREQEVDRVTPLQLMSLAEGECIMTYQGKHLYNLRTPMLDLTPQDKRRLGPLKINRFRRNFVQGMDYFKNIDRYLSVAQARAIKDSGESADKENDNADNAP